MAEQKASVSNFLIKEAALAISECIVSAAAVVGFGPAGAIAGRAVCYFGPRIAKFWMEKFKKWRTPDSAAQLEALANMSDEEADRQAREAVEAVAPPNASRADKEVAIAYVRATAGAVRRSLVTDPNNGRSICPGDCVPKSEAEVLGMLPTSAPPFVPPCDLPDTPFQLVEVIGTGGFGVVYRAVYRGEQYSDSRAIKFCLDPERAVSLQREQALFDRLIQIAKQNWPASIVRMYGYRLDANPPYVIYEFVSGGELSAQVLRQRQQTGAGLPEAEALFFVRKIAGALAFAHAQGLVHRDLKPSNVLLSGDGVKLVDFGIAGVVEHSARTRGSSEDASTLDSNRSIRGSGTMFYMCEDQRRGADPHPRHDLYSLGVMWYQLLAGDISRPMPPAWRRALIRSGIQSSTLDLIEHCVGMFPDGPATAGELLELIERAFPAEGAPRSRTIGDVLRTIREEEERIAARRLEEERQAAERRQQFFNERVERLKARVAELLARKEYMAALHANNELLQLKRNDAEALETHRVLMLKLSGPPGASSGGLRP